MSSRKSPTGPSSFLTGFITVGDTAVASSSAQSTFTAIAKIAVPPSGTASANMNGRVMSTNDVVSITPRVVPLSTTAGVPTILAYARVKSVENSSITTAVAIIEVGLQSPLASAAVAVSNTYDINVFLRSADL